MVTETTTFWTINYLSKDYGLKVLKNLLIWIELTTYSCGDMHMNYFFMEFMTGRSVMYNAIIYMQYR